MTIKEKAAIKNWQRKEEDYRKEQQGLWEELGELYVIRGGGKQPTYSMLAHYDYLMTSGDPQLRERIRSIWARYHEIRGQLDARIALGQALAKEVTP